MESPSKLVASAREAVGVVESFPWKLRLDEPPLIVPPPATVYDSPPETTSVSVVSAVQLPVNPLLVPAEPSSSPGVTLKESEKSTPPSTRLTEPATTAAAPAIASVNNGR